MVQVSVMHKIVVLVVVVVEWNSFDNTYMFMLMSWIL